MCIKDKKVWRKPKLIIIGQGRPEENVLSGCKYNDSAITVLPYVSRSNCNELELNCGACQPNGKGQS
jgi:hypothetical protein